MLTLTKTYDTTLTIDDEPVQMHIKRLTKSEAIAFEREFFRFGRPRGPGEDATDDEKTASRQFVEDSIAAYVSLDAGQITDDGRDVTTGDDVIRAFCARGDVLAAFYQAIYAGNFLGKAQKKILSALPISSPGSARSMPPLGGAAPAPTVSSAAPSSTAPSAAATDASSPDEADAPESSGDKVH